MTKCPRLNVWFLLWLSSPLLANAQVGNQTPLQSDYSKEAVVLEQSSDKFKFENDGTSNRELSARLRVQSDAGVQQLGVLKFSYQSSSESFAVDYVRVRKSDGTVVATPSDNFQDMPADVTRAAPFYSDIQEKHVAVRGLEVGDVLEYRAHWQRTKPLDPGQFWLEYNFIHDGIVQSEEVQVSVPRDKPIKMKSLVLKPTITEDSSYRVYTWKNSNLEHSDEQKQKQQQQERIRQIPRGQLPQSDVQISTYHNWDEVGRWYADLQRDRVKPSDEIRAKATELTKGATDDLTKTRVLYNFVSTRYRYIGIAFGIGRYQPHSAADVLQNQYGDCKDKNTLLIALLNAAGIKAFSALISSASDVEVDVPSPGQFNHVITVVPQSTGLVWLDTTTEVGPFGYLVPQLRGKRALVIRDDKPSELMASPANLPFPAVQIFRMDAKLTDKGLLEGKTEQTLRGDREVLLRSAFRSVPVPQWKDLVQQISLASGFGGEVTDITATPPEKTDDDFHFTYNYKREDYSDWSNHRITPPLPTISLPDLPDEGSKPASSIWLGETGEIQLKAQLELPKGLTPQLPPTIHIKREFADYDASYVVKNGVLSAERHLVVKASEVRPSEYEEYRKFRADVDADYNRFTVLTNSRSSYQDAIWELPYSDNAKAAQAYDQAREEFQKNNPPGEIASLQHAVEIDPKFARAWFWLGEIYRFNRQPSLAVEAYRKGIEAAPQEPVGYKALGYTLMSLQKHEEAIPVWTELSKIAPDDPDGLANLAYSFIALHRYQEAIAALESSIKINPDQPRLQYQLGSAYLQSGNEEKAVAAFQSAIDSDSSSDTLHSVMLNDVAYELAVKKKDLPLALQYAEKAVREEEDESSKIQIAQLQFQGLAASNRLAAYWDTLGWVHFALGNLTEAEKYLKAAWAVSQGADSGEHLGQLFDKLGKKQQALRYYSLALEVLGRDGNPEMRERLKSSVAALSSGPDTSSVAKNAGAELSEERTYKLPQIHAWGGGHKSAEFVVVLTKESGVADTKFLSGADDLRKADLSSLKSSFPFPDDSHARIVRSGVLSCSDLAKGCIFVFYTADAMRVPVVAMPVVVNNW